MEKIEIASILNDAEKLNGKYQVRYSDYDVNQFTIPARINQKRIADIMDDASVKEVRIILSL